MKLTNSKHGGGYKNKVTPNKNKTLKVAVLTAIISVLLTSGICVVAVNLSAKDIGFTSTNEGWKVTNVEDAINDLFDIGRYEITPDTYFYDSSTSGEEIVRYKKIDGKYYLCDVNGNITDESEQDVTGITLTEYLSATEASLVLGKAGFANSNLLLGNGLDAGLLKSGDIKVDVTRTHIDGSGYSDKQTVRVVVYYKGEVIIDQSMTNSSAYNQSGSYTNTVK